MITGAEFLTITDDGTNNLQADLVGADGPAIGQVVGVAFGAASVAAGTAIAGSFGTLTLLANGDYKYTRTVGGGSDTFLYTLRDLDGSTSTARLVINAGDGAPTGVTVVNPGNDGGVGVSDTSVSEAGLPGRGAAPGEPPGTDAAANSEVPRGRFHLRRRMG